MRVGPRRPFEYIKSFDVAYILSDLASKYDSHQLIHVQFTVSVATDVLSSWRLSHHTEPSAFDENRVALTNDDVTMECMFCMEGEVLSVLSCPHAFFLPNLNNTTCLARRATHSRHSHVEAMTGSREAFRTSGWTMEEKMEE